METSDILAHKAICEMWSDGRIEAFAIDYIKQGAALSYKSQSGETMVDVAVWTNSPAALTVLVERGADVNYTNTQGETPIGIAAYWGYVDIFKILLQAGADPDRVDARGYTAEKRLGVMPTNKEFKQDIQNMIDAHRVKRARERGIADSKDISLRRAIAPLKPMKIRQQGGAS